MQTALQNGLTTLNLTTPPVTAAEVYTTVTGKADWHNELPKPPFDYDLRTGMLRCWAGRAGYLCTKQQGDWMRSAPLCAHGGTEDVRTETCNFQYCVG